MIQKIRLRLYWVRHYYFYHWDSNDHRPGSEKESFGTKICYENCTWETFSWITYQTLHPAHCCRLFEQRYRRFPAGSHTSGWTRPEPPLLAGHLPCRASRLWTARSTCLSFQSCKYFNFQGTYPSFTSIAVSAPQSSSTKFLHSKIGKLVSIKHEESERYNNNVCNFRAVTQTAWTICSLRITQVLSVYTNTIPSVVKSRKRNCKDNHNSDSPRHRTG